MKVIPPTVYRKKLTMNGSTQKSTTVPKSIRYVIGNCKWGKGFAGNTLSDLKITFPHGVAWDKLKTKIQTKENLACYFNLPYSLHLKS